MLRSLAVCWPKPAKRGEAKAEDWDSTANAEHLADASGRGPRNYGLVGGYARIFFWSFLSFGVVTGIYFLLHG